MSLDAATITQLSRTILEDYDESECEIVGVAATHGGSDRVELLVSLPDGDAGRRIHMLNLTRTRRADFEQDLRHRLTEL